MPRHAARPRQAQSRRSPVLSVLAWLMGSVAALLVLVTILALVAALVTAASKLPLWRGLVIGGAVPAALAASWAWCDFLERLGSRLPEPPRGGVLAWAPAVIVTAFAAYGLDRTSYLSAQNHPGAVYGVLLVPVVALVLTWIGEGVFRYFKPAPTAEARAGADMVAGAQWIIIVPAAVLLAVGILAANRGENDRSSSTGELNLYCRYGAVSQAQLEGCLDHVTTKRVDHLKTNAARFAQGQLQACLSDSGPFCADALTLNNAAQSLDPNQGQ